MLTSEPGAQRLAFGRELYIVVPAARARQVAYVLHLGAEVLRSRDGVTGVGWCDELLQVLRVVDAEHRSEPALSLRGSASRTVETVLDDSAALWVHDTVTIAEASDLTGFSAGYLCRLGRTGLGYKRAGAWHLDRRAILELAERRCD